MNSNTEKYTTVEQIETALANLTAAIYWSRKPRAFSTHLNLHLISLHLVYILSSPVLHFDLQDASLHHG
jgi:hypothetical protein